MRLMHWHWGTCTLLLSLATLLTAGCDDGDGPVFPILVAGTYALQSIDGDALPAPAWYAESTDRSIVIVADTLWLNADGTGSRRQVQETVDPGSGERARDLLAKPLYFRTTDDGADISLRCPLGVLCIETSMTARLTSSGLIATPLTEEPQHQLVYAKIRGPD